jgi:large subunit ribosomal protein L10
MLYSEKIQMVSELAGRFENAPMTLLADYRGLTVSEITDLRLKLKKVDGELLVAKNTLTRLAIHETKNEVISEWLSGPIALAFGYGEPVEIAKAMSEFAKGNDALELKGGVLDGQRLDASEVNHLASLPGKDELRAKLLALLVTPATQLVRLLSTPAGQMAQVLGSRQRQLEEEQES